MADPRGARRQRAWRHLISTVTLSIARLDGNRISTLQGYSLLCRDYLRSQPVTAASCQVVKERLISWFPRDAERYYEQLSRFKGKTTMIQTYCRLWHRHTDEEGRDHDKLLGIYSTQERAEIGLALMRGKPGFQEYPDGFEINEGTVDRTYMTEGFVTVWGDETSDNK